MSRFTHFAMAAIVAASSLLSFPQMSRAADTLLVWQPARVSMCAYPHFLNKIVSRFRHQVRHVPYLPNVAITNFHDVQEVDYLPVAERRPIARLYCSAIAELSNGDLRPVWYLIEGGMGFASIGDNVEFCVAGFDRWMVYDGQCRVLR